ncbi:type II toxin-antitoxin system ParD family antitoxin [Phyllobacterium chamaecytisi]|uniref:type II toxin-antitoxin system ParD family antitoxin n=1 Tax=Phyllobacterium chamaecytisi TaxID=2876082 RepID=UPI001CCC3E62|nr:type II toxin-antitoxin system ParD family antitoxin [Phyllobacterium sp. KW56]MBZ9605155.1 type II toxin-antitoxin system ParD family antitoxin [Phyllobacterium sp. KW56]
MVEKLSITLPSEMVNAIKSRVEAGSYASTSEVLREAMRLLLRQEEEHSERMAAIRARIQRSLNDPRPNLSSKQARHHLDDLYAKHQTVK